MFENFSRASTLQEPPGAKTRRLSDANEYFMMHCHTNTKSVFFFIFPTLHLLTVSRLTSSICGDELCLLTR